MLSLSAGEMINALMLLPDESAGDADGRRERHRAHRRTGGMGSRFALAVMDGDFTIIAASPRAAPWQGKQLDELISSGQPLFMFGERAGVMEVMHRRRRSGTPRSTSPTSAPARSPR